MSERGTRIRRWCAVNPSARTTQAHKLHALATHIQTETQTQTQAQAYADTHTTYAALHVASNSRCCFLLQSPHHLQDSRPSHKKGLRYSVCVCVCVCVRGYGCVGKGPSPTEGVTSYVHARALNKYLPRGSRDMNCCTDGAPALCGRLLRRFCRCCCCCCCCCSCWCDDDDERPDVKPCASAAMPRSEAARRRRSRARWNWAGAARRDVEGARGLGAHSTTPAGMEDGAACTPNGARCRRARPTRARSSKERPLWMCVAVDITSHHIASHHITSHHITSHHITSHHITHHACPAPTGTPTT